MLEELQHQIDTKEKKDMTESELQFHYFKLHDFDNNNLLDGLEIVKALKHNHDQGNCLPFLIFSSYLTMFSLPPNSRIALSWLLQFKQFWWQVIGNNNFLLVGCFTSYCVWNSWNKVTRRFLRYRCYYKANSCLLILMMGNTLISAIYTVRTSVFVMPS